MKLPNFLNKTSHAIEFWVDPQTDEVMCLYQGSITKIEDASVEVGTALMEHIINQNEFDRLHDNGFKEPIELMKEFIRRYFAGFDYNTDLTTEGQYHYEYTGHRFGLNPSDLTDREIEYIQLTAQDCSDKMIADRMDISYNTACKHRQNAEFKTGCYSKAGLLSWAYKEGIL